MKSIKPQILVVIISLLILFIVWTYFKKSTQNDNNASVEIGNTYDTTAIDPSLILSDASTYTTAADHTGSIPDQKQLDVPYISQYPELPTGCEITALTEALNFYGFSANKEDMARNYLPTRSVKEIGCYINYFYGSPWSDRGSGCFAPAITQAANTFLTQSGSSLCAETISYSSVKTLFEHVANGNPVIVWTSRDYNDRNVSYNEIDLGNGQSFSWPENEHCVVLSGYDLTEHTVTLADPDQGIVTRSISDFTYFYQKYYYQAVVIK